MSEREKTFSIRRTARIAGFLYLIILVLAPFSMMYVSSALIVPGDARATVRNIVASEGLFRLGIVSDSIIFLTEIALSVMLYVLFKAASKTLSLIAAFSRLGESFILGVNVIIHLFVLLLLSGADYLKAFEPGQLHTLVLLFLNAHNDGILVSQVFFGFHLFFLGFLLVKSGYFPRILGILIFLASAGYLIESFGNFLLPDYADILSWIVVVFGVVGELPFIFWLLFRGVNVEKWKKRLLESD